MKRAANGFTLVEVIIAAAITGLIMLGMQSALIVASHASPSRTGVGMQTMCCGLAADQLASDLSYATSFNSTSASAIEMVVPDRTGDGLPETIRYSWTGVSGDPLLRSFNADAPVQLVTDVRQFTLGYVTKASKLASSYTESAETLLFCSDGGNYFMYPTVSSKIGVAEAFTPTIPSTASYWRVTRVKFPAKTNVFLTASEIQVQLRSAVSATSLQSVVSDYAKVYTTANALAYSWLEADFNNSAHLSPGKTVGVVLLHSADGTDFNVFARTDANFSNAAYAYSSDTGVTWAGDMTKALPMYVYGVTGSANADAYQYNLTHVTCQLKSGPGTVTQIHTDFRVLNQPQVSGP